MTGSSQPSYVRSVAILSAGFFGIFMAFNTAQVCSPRTRCTVRKTHGKTGGRAIFDLCVPSFAPRASRTPWSQALETTIVSKDLADISLASLYACFTVAAVVAPKVVQVLDPRCASSSIAFAAPPPRPVRALRAYVSSLRILGIARAGWR